MSRYRVVERRGAVPFQIQRKGLFGRWHDCNDADVTHCYATLEAAVATIRFWQTGERTEKVVWPDAPI